MNKKYCRVKRLIALGLTLILLLAYVPSALAATFSAIVTSSSMAVYGEASFSNKLGSLKKNTVVQVKKYSGNVALISYGGRTGYAKVSDMKALDDVAEEAVVNTNTRVYQSASTKSANVALKKGVKLNLIAVSGNWAMVEKGGNVGYMNAKHVTLLEDISDEPAATATPEPTKKAEITIEMFQAVATENVKVYKSASTSSASLGTLKKGVEVTVGAYNSEGWAYIRLDGKYGYCKMSALERKTSETATPTPAPTATPSIENAVKGTVTVSKLPVYKSASTSSSKLGNIYKGQVVNVLKWNGTWGYIELNGRYGYCNIKGLVKTSTQPSATPEPTATLAPTATPSVENAVKGTVTADKTMVYKSASTSSEKLGNIYKGQVVNVLKWNSTWGYIELDGKYGYCSIKALTPTSNSQTPEPTATPSTEDAVKGTVTVSKLPVYKSASTSSSKLGNIYKGQVVNVLRWNSTWAYIELDGKYGFCSVKGLSKTDSTPAPTPTPSIENAVKATVTADSVKVYQTASEQGTYLGTLKKGREVNVISWSGEWAFIELNGRYGFCKVSALTPSDEIDKIPDGFTEGGFTASVVYPGAKVYASASTSATSASLALGATVNVYAYNKDWACIVWDNGYGFVPVKHLNRTSYETIDSDGSALQTLLKALLSYGYYDMAPSTNYNTAAVTAIKRFQSACGLKQTGVADQTMQRILFSGYAPVDSILSKTLSKGDDNSNVSRLQTRLYVLGYLSKTSSVDGDYGTNTANAVKLFQSANGISTSGTADVKTLKAIYSTGAKSKPSGVNAADAGGSSSSGGSSSYLTTMPSSVASFTTSYNSSMSNAEKLEYVIYVGQNQLGKPYVYGAEGPNKYDCSGFTQYCFKQIGVSLKRSAYSQGYDSSYTKISSTGSLKRGDLVFFNTVSDSDLSDHTGIYLGSGYFIHASSGGKKVVVSNLNSGYYNRVFCWGRSILK